MATRRLACFFHVPKTGGTSIRELLKKSLPRKRFFWQGDGGNPLGYQYLDQVPEDSRLDYFKRLRLVGGHFGYLYTGILRDMGIAPVFAAVVREPFARTVSHYEYLEKRQGRTPTAEHFYKTFYDMTDFWKDPNCHQLFWITGQTEFDVGIRLLLAHTYLIKPLENIKSLVTDLAEHIPELEVNELKVNNKNKDLSYMQKYDNHAANRDIREFFSEDMRFYQYVIDRSF